MNKFSKILLTIFLLLSLGFETSYAIGRGDENVIFQNKTTGKYKQTYRILYRFDIDIFRDSLDEYIRDFKIPNTDSFKNWTVVYYRYCDREDCVEKGKLDSNIDYNALENISSKDFTYIEFLKILKLSIFLYFFREILTLIIVLIIYLIFRELNQRRYLKKQLNSKQ